MLAILLVLFLHGRSRRAAGPGQRLLQVWPEPVAVSMSRVLQADGIKRPALDDCRRRPAGRRRAMAEEDSAAAGPGRWASYLAGMQREMCRQPWG